MPGSYLISGSILGGDHLALGDAVRGLQEAGADMIQLDVADGHFTPTITFGEELVRRTRATTDLPLEVHLMVSRPQDWFTTMGEAGADVILFHAEAAVRLHALVEQARASVAKVGVVLNTETPPDAVRYVLPHVDVVMLMGILPGFAGQPFVDSTLDKIVEIRELVSAQPHGRRPLISVDGGVTATNAARIVDAGADILVASSALFSHGEMTANAAGLRETIRLGADERPWVSRYRHELTEVVSGRS